MGKGGFAVALWALCAHTAFALGSAHPEKEAELSALVARLGRARSLLEAFEAQERQIRALKARLAALDEAPDHAEASRLGITALLEDEQLPPRQRRRVAAAIVREARRNGLDPLLVAAVIRVESGFDLFAVSPAGAMGLMQVMPETGRYWAKQRGQKLARKTDLFDGELNIELGASYLADLIRRFGRVETALVAYNAGPTAARRILSNPVDRQRFLRGYPAAVLRTYRQLQIRQKEALARRAEPPGSGG